MSTATNNEPLGSQGPIAEQFEAMDQQREADHMGMWLFLGTELLLFGGVLAGFIVLRVVHADAFAEAAGHLDLTLGTLNTTLLLTTGLTMALAERRASGGQRRATLLWLAATLIIGVVFLGIKGYEWHYEYTEKLMPVLGLPFDYPGAAPQRAELFFNFYYILTGLHALHMTIGLGLLATVGVLVWRWRAPSQNARQVQISGLYWAFVDALWVIVYTLLYLLRG